MFLVLSHVRSPGFMCHVWWFLLPLSFSLQRPSSPVGVGLFPGFLVPGAFFFRAGRDLIRKLDTECLDDQFRSEGYRIRWPVGYIFANYLTQSTSVPIFPFGYFQIGAALYLFIQFSSLGTVHHAGERDCGVHAGEIATKSGSEICLARGPAHHGGHQHEDP